MSKPQSPTTDDDTHSFTDSADDYQTVLNAVADTTDADDPLASRATVLHEAVGPEGPDSETVHAMFAAAEANDDLLSWHGKLARTDTESLRAVATAEADSTHPRRELLRRIVALEADRADSNPELIGLCNRVLHGGDA